jgi:two-component system sensor histidine kinase KdpD
LLSSISHDFRSPLAAIIGSSTSLLEYGDKFDEAVRHDLLLNIHDEGEKLNQFVANLLNLTRLHSGVVQPVRERVGVGQIIRDAVERVERHRGETLAIRTGGDCEAAADPLLLEQSIYNIVDNAVKYGGAADDIDVRCSANGTTCTIVVADRGPGLPESDRDNIFTSFYFVRRTGRSKGTGLGLSIAKGFVEAMGGSIEARARSDGQSGLEIAIDLPRNI